MHSFFKRMSREPWADRFATQVSVAAGDEKIDFFTFNHTPGSYLSEPIEFVAFTRNAAIIATVAHERSWADVTVLSRAGLTRLDLGPVADVFAVPHTHERNQATSLTAHYGETRVRATGTQNDATFDNLVRGLLKDLRQ